MHAIIETGGKQYKVAEGDVLFIEKLPQQAGDEIKFDKVLAVLDGDEPKFGAPVVEGASVDASVVKNGKGKKVVIFKYKPKKGYRHASGPSPALHQGRDQEDQRLMTKASFRNGGQPHRRPSP